MKAVKNDGGLTLKRPKVVLVFLGGGWTAAGLPSTADAEAAFRAALASPYMSALAQYEGIGRAEIVAVLNAPSVIGAVADDPRKFLPKVQLIAETQITDALGPAIDFAGRPDGEETLYMAIISSDPTPVVSEHANAGGYHKQFVYKDKTYSYGVVLNWAGNTADNIWESSGALPVVFTHEVVEACTDPDGSGYHLDSPPNAADPGENELCDYAATDSSPSSLLPLSGFSRQVRLEGYWSNLDATWVVPTTYSLRALLGQQTREFVPSVRSALGTGSVRSAIVALDS